MSDETYSPGEADNMPGFQRFAIPGDLDLLISDTSVFVGWKQVSEDFLNLGYDVNRNSLQRVFVNISGDWFNPGSSLKEGTPMMRAVFGGRETITGTDPEHNVADIRVYPNPASGKVFIQSGTSIDFKYSLTDMHGRTLRQEANSESIDVSDLPSGLYMLRIVPAQGTPVIRKLVVRH